MNLLEQQLDYPLADALPPQGGALTIAPGIKWLRMALPFALDHINLWLLRDEMDDPSQPGHKIQGWSVVDCCISRSESKAQWEAIFATQLEGLPVLRVIVTHMHRLASQSSTSFGGEGAARFFAAHGLSDPQALDGIKNRSGYYTNLVPDVPLNYARLMDGLVLRIGGKDWHCISGYGHAPEHIALYCSDAGMNAGLEASANPTQANGILISGDMVLPRISTNVSVYEMEPEANALTQFLSSLEKFLPLPLDTLVLPSHGKPFRGLQTRIAQLQDHHRDRLAEVVQACAAGPCCAADILPLMFKRKLDLHQTTFAMGEAVAHLHALWFEGQLTRRLGEDGIYRFSAV